jgi:hypothetical protein
LHAQPVWGTATLSGGAGDDEVTVNNPANAPVIVGFYANYTGDSTFATYNGTISPT